MHGVQQSWLQPPGTILEKRCKGSLYTCAAPPCPKPHTWPPPTAHGAPQKRPPEQRRQLAVARSPARLPLRAGSRTFKSCCPSVTERTSLPLGPRLSQDQQHRPLLLSRRPRGAAPSACKPHSSATAYPPVMQPRRAAALLPGQAQSSPQQSPPPRAKPGNSSKGMTMLQPHVRCTHARCCAPQSGQHPQRNHACALPQLQRCTAAPGGPITHPPGRPRLPP